MLPKRFRNYYRVAVNFGTHAYEETSIDREVSTPADVVKGLREFCERVERDMARKAKPTPTEGTKA